MKFVSKSVLSALAFVAVTASAATKAKTAPTPIEIDREVSVINWEGTKKVGDKHVGTVKFKEGQIVIENDEFKGANFVADLVTISNTDVKDPEYSKKLNDHLKSADFFDIAKFPTATFKVSSVKPIVGSKQGHTHTVEGDLTIKGKTEKVSFPATVTKLADKIEAKADLTFDRIKHDVKYNSDKLFKNLGDKIINDEVKLSVLLHAPLKTAKK